MASPYASIHSAKEWLLPQFEQNMEFNPGNLFISTVCIEDIFMTSRNVTQSVDRVDVINFKQYCEEQHNLLRIMGDSIRFYQLLTDISTYKFELITLRKFKFY